MNILHEYRRWLSSDKVSEEMKAELLAIAENDEELRLRFASSLSFGTAGLRGTMAAGINNMNIHTVGRATQGLADYIAAQGGGTVVIAYDTRNNSELFAHTSAEVLAANGLSVYLFDGARPTPELSFAVRHFSCIAGINVTASHNPKEYNGYKAYWADGAQLAPEQAEAVASYMMDCDLFEGVRRMPLSEAKTKGLVTMIGAEVDEAYMAAVLEQMVDPSQIRSQRDMTVVYTPLHGAGYRLVPEVLRRAGLEKVLVVAEQENPNGDFPTVHYPNPEFPEAFTLAKTLADSHHCDLIIATDPDADRMGINIRVGKDYLGLTGNQVGCLLLDYIVTACRENGGIPADAYAVKSIVTTELASRICEANGVTMFDVLIGFKFIGEVIKKHEEAGYGTYLLGFEESYGYLKGTYARDKDAVVAALLVTEMAAYYRAKGMTLKDALDSLYIRYGNFGEAVSSIAMSGSDGKQRMAALMTALRDNPPTVFAGEAVRVIRDYQAGTITDLVSGRCEPTGLPSSDVLYYVTENTVLVIRPSGTEPKVKVYFMAKGETADEVKARLDACREAAKDLFVG
ncbi:MAG: phospho-sugar mutase [Ruminococcaceae bacterium]|nr:phospho-sugar mutase [Oscillospiraceae bacterium]